MVNIWQISPGREERGFWSEFKNGNIIAMGWDELGDLGKYSSEKDIENGLRRHFSYPKDKYPANDISSIKIFSQFIKKGDIIVAKKGASKEVYGIGKVMNEYRFDESREWFQHVIDVDWIIGFDRKITVRTSKEFMQRTAGPLKLARFEEIRKSMLAQFPNLAGAFERLGSDIQVSSEIDEKIYDRIWKLLQAKKQIILYGPPGTGKTWIAKRFAQAYLKRNPPKFQVRKEAVTSLGKFVRFVSFHQSYSYEEFVEGIRPVITELEVGDQTKKDYEISKGIFKRICEDARNDRDNNYFLIIDEINRGQISKIFGELITLLEKDKRLSSAGDLQENTIILDLVYSKQPFSVPWNLYIIGTMNTADKSIALVDVALRRRFGFLEVPPEPEKLKVHKIQGINLDLPKILESINRSIAMLVDRDHQIGHSYLMNIDKDEMGNTINDEKRIIENLRFAIYNEVIPLLQEYFYNDWERLKQVIPGFIRTVITLEEASQKMENANQGIYEIADNLNDQEFLKALSEL